MNPTSEYQFTIVVPVYNEVENCPLLEERLASYLPICPVKACVLFVNDGSTDGSAEKLREICRRHKDMFYISFERNTGLTAAIKAGFDYAESPLVGYMDADMQTSVEDFTMLLPHADEYELVTGFRANRKDNGWRRFQSRFANGFRRMMTGDEAVDTGCPLKVMHTDVAKRLPPFTGMHRFIPAIVGLMGGKVKQLPVSHYDRVAGTAKFNMANRVWKSLVDCFGFRYMRSRWFNYKVAETDLKE